MAGLRSVVASPAVVRGARIVAGVLLIWASLAKLGDLGRFAEQVHNFRILPLAAENLVAMTLPWVELVAGLALVLAIRDRSAAAVAVALFGVFTLAVLAAVARGLDFECGCFGTSDATRVGFGKLGQNVAMLAVAAVALVRPSERTPRATTAASARSRATAS